jgi:uncharacterized alkaline shock family protein YloU
MEREKMGMFDRLFLFFFYLGTAIFALFCFLVTLGLGVSWDQIVNYLHQWSHDPNFKDIITVTSLLTLILSLRFLLLLCKWKMVDIGVDRLTSMGYVSISLSTIRSLTIDAARKVKGVRDITARVYYYKKQSSVGIKVKVIVDGETALQPLTEQLQMSVKEQVENIAGINVDHVSVYVDQIAQPDRSRIRV